MFWFRTVLSPGSRNCPESCSWRSPPYTTLRENHLGTDLSVSSMYRNALLAFRSLLWDRDWALLQKDPGINGE
jgi:hypothetical protein